MHYFDFGPYQKIEQQRRELDGVSKAARDSKRRIEELQAQLDRLHLGTTAMWELVRERTGLTEDDLLAKIQEVDLRDGRDDGRVRTRPDAQPVSCPACGRPNSRQRKACLYCGDALPRSSPL